jgi:hypothetical protein
LRLLIKGVGQIVGLQGRFHHKRERDRAHVRGERTKSGKSGLPEMTTREKSKQPDPTRVRDRIGKEILARERRAIDLMVFHSPGEEKRGQTRREQRERDQSGEGE